MTRTGQLVTTPACPHCGAPSDGYTAVGDHDSTPAPGDIAVCLYCCEVQVYDHAPAGLLIRRPTPDEAEAFANDGDIIFARAAALQARDQGGFEKRGRLQ